MGDLRTSMTQDERRKKFQETHDVATALVTAQRAARDTKTARLRQLREAAEAEAVATARKKTAPDARRGSSKSDVSP